MLALAIYLDIYVRKVVQVRELQVKIDGLYNSAFSNIEVAYKPESIAEEANEIVDVVEEKFPDLNESTFGLLGRQRPHVMKVRLQYFFKFCIAPTDFCIPVRSD